MKLDVVLISGKEGSGKSTLAAEIRKNIKKLDDQGRSQWVVEEMIFAGAIYDMHDHCRSVLSQNGVKLKGQKDRALLQFLGTDWGRKEYGDNVWTNVLREKVRDRAKILERWNAKRLTIVIPDCRFKNELNFWPDALKIRLECPTEIRRQRCLAWGDDNHPSETDLDDALDKFDFAFDSGKLPAETIAGRIVSHLLTT